MDTNIKKIIAIAVILLAISVLFFSGCASEQQTIPPVTEPSEEPEAEEPEAEEPEAEEPEAEEPGDENGEERLFTMAEIANYDGQDGRRAYIVVEGVVYDVTDVRQWRSGTHFGFTAGTDVTEALGSAAPHGANLLGQAEIVGRIAN